MYIMPDASVYKDNLLVLDPSLNTQSCNRRPRAATAAKDAKDWSLPSFGSHLNPISTRGADYAQPILSPWLAKIRRGGSDLYVVHSDLRI